MKTEYMNDQKGGALAWIAFIIAVVALILAWIAFNRSGTDISEIVDREVREAVAELEVNFEQAEDQLRKGAADTLESGADALDEGAQNIEN